MDNTRFLVVSYDDDEQQWFYDIVLAENAEAAAEMICTIRPYVIDADASTVEQVALMAVLVKERSRAEIEEDLAAIRSESGIEEKS